MYSLRFLRSQVEKDRKDLLWFCCAFHLEIVSDNLTQNQLQI